MSLNVATNKKQYEPGRINPQQFGLWISMASLLMMFAAFTSAYIVRIAAGNWLEFPIPSIFNISTVVIILSSITLQLSFNGYKSGKEWIYKSFLVLTFLLGIGFLVLQNDGWYTLYNNGVDFKINPSSSFFYLIGWVHAAHIVAALTTTVVAMIHAFTLKFEYKEYRKNRFSLVVQFWHFLGILWIALFLFLTFYR
jgi:cytochrome c oxidase subunit 3